MIMHKNCIHADSTYNAPFRSQSCLNGFSMAHDEELQGMKIIAFTVFSMQYVKQSKSTKILAKIEKQQLPSGCNGCDSQFTFYLKERNTRVDMHKTAKCKSNLGFDNNILYLLVVVATNPCSLQCSKQAQRFLSPKS